jgi:hypothetical protein
MVLACVDAIEPEPEPFPMQVFSFHIFAVTRSWSRWLLAIAMTGSAGTAAAQAVPDRALPAEDITNITNITTGIASNSNRIDGTALRNAGGNLTINSSSGSGSAQTNDAAIAIGNGAAAALLPGAGQSVSPAAGAAPSGTPGMATASRQDAVIGGAAFQGASGRIAVNQSSGDNNRQANLATVAIGALLPGASEIGVAELARQDSTATPVSLAGDRYPRHADIADSAFTGASGVAQVNQAAGIGNRSANLFTLRVNSGLP